MITPEQAEHIYNTHKPYATIEDFKSILSAKVYNRYDKSTEAIDVLEIPLDKATTFPHWVVLYLHGHRDKVIEENDLLVEAIQAGYRKYDIRRVKSFLENSQSNVGFWYDSKTKKTYYRWYEPSELTDKVQECLDRGDNW